MVVKIHGFPQATSTLRVTVVCEEAGVPYEVVPVNSGTAEHKTAAHLEKQPFGQVPYIDDDGFTLFESRAIARYIAAKANSPLLPPASDLRASSRFEQAVSIEASNFDPFVYEFAFEKVIGPREGIPTDEARVARLTASFAQKLEGYERILSQQKYLAGDTVTLADLFHLPGGEGLGLLGVRFLEDEQRYPNTARWWKELQARPAWKAVNSPRQ